MAGWNGGGFVRWKDVSVEWGRGVQGLGLEGGWVRNMQAHAHTFSSAGNLVDTKEEDL